MFDMAAANVNKAKLFSGNVQLRVEVLTVDPGGSGSATTATEVASAFARKGHTVGVFGEGLAANTSNIMYGYCTYTHTYTPEHQFLRASVLRTQEHPHARRKCLVPNVFTHSASLPRSPQQRDRRTYVE